MYLPLSQMELIFPRYFSVIFYIMYSVCQCRSVSIILSRFCCCFLGAFLGGGGDGGLMGVFSQQQRFSSACVCVCVCVCACARARV